MIKAKVFVTLKPSVLDPQGKQVMNSLHSIGYDNIKEVRVSKFIEVTLDSNNLEQAEQEIQEICEKILANPNTETYSWNLEEVTGE
ncbi:MAG: phosphoribosylformylglycinamidine synthase subunit PurS [Candidatus Cloacimonadales bacterium]